MRRKRRKEGKCSILVWWLIFLRNSYLIMSIIVSFFKLVSRENRKRLRRGWKWRENASVLSSHSITISMIACLIATSRKWRNGNDVARFAPSLDFRRDTSTRSHSYRTGTNRRSKFYGRLTTSSWRIGAIRRIPMWVNGSSGVKRSKTSGSRVWTKTVHCSAWSLPVEVRSSVLPKVL